MPKDSNPRAKLQLSLSQLTEAARDLNRATDEIREAIGEVDSLLSHLNLGISTWAVFDIEVDEDAPQERTEFQLGYAKVGLYWGTAIRTVDVDLALNEQNVRELWKFNDAPRLLRMKAIQAIPELIDKLTDETIAIAKHASERARIAKELSNALVSPNETKGERK